MQQRSRRADSRRRSPGSSRRATRSRCFRPSGLWAALLLASALLVGASTGSAAQDWAKRKPRNDRENIEKIGSRNVTGILNILTMKQEIQLGRQHARRINSQLRIVEDPVIAEYVNRLGQNIGRNSDVKVPLEIRVVEDSQINAFALPGGFIYVNTGLIEFARDESELAGVMGHEIAHIAGRHSTRQISRSYLISMTAETLLRAYGGNNTETTVAMIAANVAIPLTFLKFSRDFEKKADLLGLQYLYKAGYDPLGMVSFFERLSAEERSRGRPLPAFFRSHPLSAKRVKLVQKAIAELLPDRPAYETSNSEFNAIKARIAQRSKVHR